MVCGDRRRDRESVMCIVSNQQVVVVRVLGGVYEERGVIAGIIVFQVFQPL